jgi:hypothetical protein
MASSELVHRLTIKIFPAQDIPGVWIAHVLDFDLVTQGFSELHALAMAFEASQMIVEADAEAGRDPFARCAPPEEWPATPGAA